MRLTNSDEASNRQQLNSGFVYFYLLKILLFPLINWLIPKSDQHPISLYNITPELPMKDTRIQGMITT